MAALTPFSRRVIGSVKAELTGQMADLSARLLSITTDVSKESVKLRLLGSDETAARAEKLAQAYAATVPDRDAIRVAEEAFLRSARRHLRISGHRWWPHRTR